MAPYAAAAIGRRFGHGENKNEAAQAIGHFMLGAALAYANGADPLAGGSAAVAAERAAEYLAGQYDDGRTAIDPISGKFNLNLLPEHIKEEIKAQTGALASVVGAAGGSGSTNTNALFNAQVGGVLGQNAVENNGVNASQAGTTSGFIEFFNNTTTKMGQQTGKNAENALFRLEDTDWRFMPSVTPPFNQIKDRYIYTTNGGWIDMVHFLFYAGKAYTYKRELILIKSIYKYKKRSSITQLNQKQLEDKAISEAVQDGFWQEKMDSIKAKHSAYSYEDLPSDKFGAIFGAKYFNPNSSLTLGQQLERYLNNVLKATNPEKAPNYKEIPKKDDGTHSGIVNRTTKPMFTGGK
nr:hypothetical protein [Neisseria lactamica]